MMLPVPPAASTFEMTGFEVRCCFQKTNGVLQKLIFSLPSRFLLPLSVSCSYFLAKSCRSLQVTHQNANRGHKPAGNFADLSSQKNEEGVSDPNEILLNTGICFTRLTCHKRIAFIVLFLQMFCDLTVPAACMVGSNGPRTCSFSQGQRSGQCPVNCISEANTTFRHLSNLY